MDRINQALQKSRALQTAGDLQGAIAVLETFRGATGFFPAAALRLMQIKQAAKDWSGARSLAEELTRHAPHLMPAWSLYLANYVPGRGHSGAGQPRWADFLETLRREPMTGGKWLRHAVFAALLHERPADWRALANKAFDGGALHPGDLPVLGRAIGFVSEIAALVATHAAADKPWSLGLEAWPEACRNQEGTIRLNSGWFRDIAPSGAWDESVCKLIAHEVIGLLGPGLFRDNVDLTSPDWVGRADFGAALAEILLLFPLRELAGLDRDIRDCGRPMAIAPGALILRAGRCELWALTSWLLDPAAQAEAAERVAAKALECVLSGQDFESWSNALPRLDPDENCNSLACNAGWYARPGRAAQAFSDWAERYLAALEGGHLLAECAEDLQRIATLRPGAAARRLHAWDDVGFARSLSGKDVVLVTAFAEGAQRHFDSGRLHALWQAANLPPPPRSLRAIEPPMSIWPYFPDTDWSASFKSLRDATAKAIAAPDRTVLLAACGCYGLPLVHDLHRALPGLTAVYNGHALNSWFGILTNDALGRFLHARAPDPGLWQIVDLQGHYPGLERIDDGRYATDRLTVGPG